MRIAKKIIWMFMLVIVIIATANFLDIFIHAQSWVDFFKGLILVAFGASGISYTADKIVEK